MAAELAEVDVAAADEVVSTVSSAEEGRESTAASRRRCSWWTKWVECGWRVVDWTLVDWVGLTQAYLAGPSAWTQSTKQV